LRKITVLLVGSPALSRIMEHLLGGRSEFEVVGTVSNLGNLRPHAERLLPELIVANLKPLSARICRVVASIKQASPLSKLILICPIEGLAPAARKCGADACLQDEELTGQLLRTARTLAERSRLAIAGV